MPSCMADRQGSPPFDTCDGALVPHQCEERQEGQSRGLMQTPCRSIASGKAESDISDHPALDLNEQEELRLLAQMGWTPSDDSEGE
ncbi:unnamed protein product, partial [Polarella glacialis]